LSKLIVENRGTLCAYPLRLTLENAHHSECRAGDWLLDGGFQFIFHTACRTQAKPNSIDQTRNAELVPRIASCAMKFLHGFSLGLR